MKAEKKSVLQFTRYHLFGYKISLHWKIAAAA